METHHLMDASIQVKVGGRSEHKWMRITSGSREDDTFKKDGGLLGMSFIGSHSRKLWFPVGDIAFVCLGGVVLLKKSVTEDRLLGFKAMCHSPNHPLCFMLMAWAVSFQMFQLPWFLPDISPLPSWTLPLLDFDPIQTFFLRLHAHDDLSRK